MLMYTITKLNCLPKLLKTINSNLLILRFQIKEAMNRMENPKRTKVFDNELNLQKTLTLLAIEVVLVGNFDKTLFSISPSLTNFFENCSR